MRPGRRLWRVFLRPTRPGRGRHWWDAFAVSLGLDQYLGLVHDVGLVVGDGVDALIPGGLGLGMERAMASACWCCPAPAFELSCRRMAEKLFHRPDGEDTAALTRVILANDTELCGSSTAGEAQRRGARPWWDWKSIRAAVSGRAGHLWTLGAGTA
jgi:hypothetical protein